MDPVRRSTRIALQSCGLEVLVSENLRRVMVFRRDDDSVDWLRTHARPIEEKLVLTRDANTMASNEGFWKNRMSFVVFDVSGVSGQRNGVVCSATHFMRPSGFATLWGVFFSSTITGVLTETDVERADAILTAAAAAM